MARISIIEADKATPQVREIYENILRGKPGNIQKALAHRPEMLKAFLTFYASVGRSLDRKLYELIYLRISFINECRYCTQHHLVSSKHVGLATEDWLALKTGNYSRYENKERTALIYVEKLTRAPAKPILTNLRSTLLSPRLSIFTCSPVSPISQIA
jgi:alkylhydroperoxidase family enzyme